MLTRFDDYPIHQTPEPVAQPATGDRNFYDRYFFNGYSRDGDLFFARGARPLSEPPRHGRRLQRRPRRAPARASAPRASRPIERIETRVGPITVEVRRAAPDAPRARRAERASASPPT